MQRDDRKQKKPRPRACHQRQRQLLNLMRRGWVIARPSAR
jgi:hypothetical protein